MSALELKVPPPVVALICAVLAWCVADNAWLAAWSWPHVLGAVVVAGVGAAVALAGVAAFRQARTTVNPMKPQQSTSVVSSGIYRFTRNPMYLGMALVLVAWSMALQSGPALIGVALFVAYITRFQIVPEERVLQGLFGQAYSDYRARVRRWI